MTKRKAIELLHSIPVGQVYAAAGWMMARQAGIELSDEEPLHLTGNQITDWINALNANGLLKLFRFAKAVTEEGLEQLH
jgi:hypothetical protein